VIAKVLLELKTKLYYFDNPQLLVKTFLLKLSMIDNFLNLEKILSSEDLQQESQAKYPKLTEEEKTKEPPQPKTDITATTEKVQLSTAENTNKSLSLSAYSDDIWLKILQEVKNKHILTYNMLKGVKLLEINEKFVKLGYTNKNNEQYYFKKEKTQEVLKNAIQKITGLRLDILFEIMDDKITEELLKNKSFARFYDAFKGRIEIE
jgi:phage regulator Rha-like protein